MILSQAKASRLRGFMESVRRAPETITHKGNDYVGLADSSVIDLATQLGEDSRDRQRVTLLANIPELNQRVEFQKHIAPDLRPQETVTICGSQYSVVKRISPPTAVVAVYDCVLVD